MIDVFVAALIAVAAGIDLPEDAQLKMNLRGELVLSIDAQQPLSPEWTVHAGRWQTGGGALAGLELPEQKHGASITHPISAQTLVVAYELKIGPKNRNATLALNSRNQHLCRLVFEPRKIWLRKPDLDHAAGPDQRVDCDTKEIALEPGKWYGVLVEVQNDEVLVHIDGKFDLYGRHEVFARTKAAVQLTSGGGDEVHYRNFRVWEGRPDPQWPLRREALRAANK